MPPTPHLKSAPKKLSGAVNKLVIFFLMVFGWIILFTTLYRITRPGSVRPNPPRQIFYYSLP